MAKLHRHSQPELQLAKAQARLAHIYTVYANLRPLYPFSTIFNHLPGFFDANIPFLRAAFNS